MAVTEKSQTDRATANYVDFDEFIDFQLRKTRSGIHQTDLISAAVVLLCLLSGYLLLFAIFDQWVIPHGFSGRARAVLLGGVVLAAGGWIGWKIVYPWLQSINALYAARQIEHSHPELKGSLLSWVNFRQAGRPVAPGILAALEKRTAHEISHANVEEAVDRRLLMRASYVLLGLVVALCLYTLLSPKNMSTTLWRALLPVSSVSAATQTEIRDVKPGNTEVLARDQVDVVAELGGKIPESVTLFYSTADRRFVNQPVKMQRASGDLPRFQARLTGDNGKGLLSDVSYRIEAGDARSATYQIQVNQPPAAEVYEVAYEYPRYMGLSPTAQAGTTIDAWEGTFVTVRARPNMPVKKAVIYCSDQQTDAATAEEYPMTVQDDLLTARWQLKFRDDGTFARYYHVQVWNDRNQKNPQPTIYRIQIRPDLKPEVTLINPDRDQTVPANAQVPVAFAVRDPDFLLRRVSLKLQHNGEDLPYPAPLFAAPPERAEFQSIYRLKLSEIPLKPEDQITLWVEAEDNFEPFGKRQKNITRSAQFTLTIAEPVTPDEAQRQEQRQEDQLQQKLEEARPQDRMEQNPQAQPRERRPGDPEDRQDRPRQEQDAPQNGNGESPAMPDQQPGQSGEQQPAGDRPQMDQPRPGKGQGDSQKAPPEQSSENRSGEAAPGENNTPAGPGENSGKQNGAGKNASSSNGQSRPGGGESQPGNSASGQQQAAPRKDKAADDQALDQLLKWNDDQQRRPPQQQKAQENKSDSTASPQEQGSTGEQKGTGNPSAGDQADGAAESMSRPPETSNRSPETDSSQKNANQNGDEAAQPMPSPKPDGNGDRESGAEQKNGPGDSPRPDEKKPSPGQSATTEDGESGASPMKEKQNSTESGGMNSQTARENAAGGQDPRAKPSAGERSSQKSGMSDSRMNETQPQTGPDNSSEQPAQPGPDGQSPNGNQKSTPGKPADAPQKAAEGEMNSQGTPTGEKTIRQQNTPPGEEPSPGMKESPNGTSGNPQPGAGENSPQQSPGKSSEAGGEKPSQPQQEGGAANPSGNKPKAPGDRQAPANNPQNEPGGSNDSGKQASGQSGGKNSSAQNDQAPSGEMKANQGNTPAGNDGSPSGQSGSKPSPSGEQNQNGEPGTPQGGSKSSSGKSMPPQEGQQSAGKNPPGENPQQKKPMPAGEKSGAGAAQSGEQAEDHPANPPAGGTPAGQENPQSSEQMPAGEQPPGQPKGEQGGKQSGGKQGGQEGGQKGEQGQQGQKGGQESGQQGGKQGGQPGGKSGDQGAGKQGGNQPGQSGQSGSSPGGPPTGGGNGVQGDATPGSGQGAGANDDQLSPEQADLQNKKKATELALKRLRDRLERGDTPQDLMNELGYSQQDLERFMQRLEDRLSDPGLDKSPESAAARRQFESILKGIDYGSTGELRGGGDHERKSSQSFGSGNRPAPPQYRRDSDAYKEKLSRQGTGN